MGGGVTRPAPYPADTRAKGWRFELDMERARQSDTWALSTPEARPWLLMLWATAWEQTPCGSLPNDDALIAARLGMPDKLFAKHKAILMRKWWLAEDGRLYHDVLVLRVKEMMERRRKESDRKALARAKKDAEDQRSPADVPRDNHGTTTGFHPESDTGTGTGTSTGEEDYGAKAPASSARVSPAAAVCIALKAEGIAAVAPGHPRLLTLLDSGATVEEFVSMAGKAMDAAPGRAFEYVLGAVEGERTRAKATAGKLHRGPIQVVSKQQAIEDNNRRVAAEWAASQGAA